MYAQTNIQLFNQLQCDGYSNAELVCIRNAYELAMRLFTGRFQASGKTFIAHVVGTASILSGLHLPAEVVAACLIHNVYARGDFGYGRKGISEAKRKQVRYAVGQEVEEYAYRFATLKWNSQTIPVIRDTLYALDPIDRKVVLMNLTNKLEHHLDLGILYYEDIETRLQYIERNGHTMVEIAEELGFPTLAADLEEVFRETAFAEIPGELRNQTGRDRSFVIAPKSYRGRLSIAFYEKLDRGPRYLRRQLANRLHRLRSVMGVGGKTRS